jgi:hypothetical protein
MIFLIQSNLKQRNGKNHNVIMKHIHLFTHMTESQELETKKKMGDENQSFDGMYFLLLRVECGPIIWYSIIIMMNFVCREKMRGS